MFIIVKVQKQKTKNGIRPLADINDCDCGILFETGAEKRE